MFDPLCRHASRLKAALGSRFGVVFSMKVQGFGLRLKATVFDLEALEIQARLLARVT